MTLEVFGLAIALAFILEGLAPALFPNKWRAYVRKLAEEEVSTIRTTGLTVIVLGVIILWLVI